MSLNPEPSMPEERAEQDLPPKSYADAAEEALQPDLGPPSHVNDSDGTTEDSARKVKGQIGEVNVRGLGLGSNEDDFSHEGIGQDGSPKSPTAKGHRRVSSRSSRASSSHKHGEKMENGVYERHPNANDSGDVLTSVKPQQEQEMAEADRRTDLKRRNSELTTGRQAGAGWAQSK